MIAVLLSPLSILILWILYLATMNLKRANDRQELTGIVRFLAYVIKYTGLAFDAYCNLVWMTILFLEIPREWLVTDRVSRKKKEGNRVAIWMCEQLLDPFDPSGCHCR